MVLYGDGHVWSSVCMYGQVDSCMVFMVVWDNVWSWLWIVCVSKQKVCVHLLGYIVGASPLCVRSAQKLPGFVWLLLTMTATPQLMLNRKRYQASKPEMEFHMINMMYAALPMRATTTFSCKDDCILTKHTRRWTYSPLRLQYDLCRTSFQTPPQNIPKICFFLIFRIKFLLIFMCTLQKQSSLRF